MQRRAAAGYAALFLLVAIVGFSLVATATPPQLTFESPDHRIADETNVTIDGVEYNASLDAEVTEPEGGGHGGGGGAELVRSGTLTTVNESAVMTATWDNGSTIAYRNSSWSVRVLDNTTARLTEQLDRAAILANDSTVENETRTIDGETYVVRLTDDGDGELIPAADYFPEPATQTVGVGDQLRYEGRAVTVDRVTTDGVVVTWTGRSVTELSVADDANVTVGDTTYYAHFPDNETLVLSRNFERVESHEAALAQHQTHTNGLWGITIVSGTGMVLLVAFSFLPSRY